MLQLLLAVFIGGGTGSVARWLLSMRFNPLHQAIPLGTLAANLIGAFIIGMGFAWFSRMTNIDPVWKVLITTGFCGGLTTFSTFSAPVIFWVRHITKVSILSLIWTASFVQLAWKVPSAVSRLCFLHP